MNMLKRIPLSVWAVALVLVPLAIHIGRLWIMLPVTDGTTIGTLDPDPWLRLTLVREWLQGGSWYSHLVTHTNVPLGGISSPWTRPLDVVIALFTQLQPHSVDLDIRLIRAALLMPLLWMGLLLFGIQRNVRIVADIPAAPFLVSALVASCLAMWNYFGTGNADHHALLCALFVWAMAGVLTTHPSPRLIVVSGLLFALQLWISPEAILLIAIVYGWYLLLNLMGNARADLWPVLATSIAFFSSIALMIERPYAEWFTAVYDSVSIVYIAMLWAAALGIWGVTLWTARTFFWRLVFGVICLQPFSYVLKLYPLIRKGPLAGVDPYIITHFMPRITEAQSLYSGHPLHVAAMLAQPALAVAALWLCSRRRPTIFSPAHTAQLAYFLLTLGALFLIQQRFFYYFYPVVVLVLAPTFAALFTPVDKTNWPARWILSYTERGQALRRLGLLIAVIGLPMLLLYLEPKQENARSQAIDSCLSATRRLIYSGALANLDHGKPLNLFISTDLGGEVLFFTPHYIVASNYHREGPGIRYMWEADAITDLDQLHAYLAQRKIEALVLCPVVKAPENSALQLLREGNLHAPWLRTIPYDLPHPVAAKEAEDKNKPTVLRLR